MKNDILKEQLKIAIDYWTKALSESNDVQQLQDDAQQQKLDNMYIAMSNGMIDISRFKLSFNYADSYDLNDIMQVTTCDLKITKFDKEHNICYCALVDDEDECISKNVFKLQTAFRMDYSNMFFAISGKNKKYAFVCKMDHIGNGIVFASYNINQHIPGLEKYRIDTIRKDIVESIDMSKCQRNTIFQNQFLDYVNLKHIKLNDKLYSIQSGAFNNCKKLEHIDFPQSLRYISNSFENCGLSSIQLPESMTLIDNDAFKNCSNLVDVVMPKHIYEIRYRVFTGSKINSLHLTISLDPCKNHIANQHNTYCIDNISTLESLTIDSIGNGNDAIVKIWSCPNLKLLKFLTYDSIKACFYDNGNVANAFIPVCQNARIEVPNEQAKEYIENIYMNLENKYKITDGRNISVVVV